MKIRYNEYVANPELRNTIKNLPAHVAQVLIAQGVAAHVPYTSVKDRIESEASLLPKPKPLAVEWGVQDANLSQYSRVTVIKRFGSETTFFAAPPADCPPSIVARFKELTDGTAQEISPDYAAVLAEGAFVGDSNKHRPIYMGKDKGGKPIYVKPEEFVVRK